MDRREPHRGNTLGYRCLYCSRTFLSSQGIAGHQKAHRFDANWMKGLRHERVRAPRRRILPMAYRLLHSQPRLVVSTNQLVPPPPFLPPLASMVRSNPISFPFNMRLMNPIPLMANLFASSTAVNGGQPVTRARVPNSMFVPAFPYRVAMGNPVPARIQPAESQDSSATVIDERVRDAIQAKEVEVLQELKDELDLELHL